ncbi:MAG: hypothetical protein FWD35_03780 [Oscillospiraceae bacterium]|nr:hypothetical protein [Oscillospiraceae bacterium]
MKYTLMHRKIPVAELEIAVGSSTITAVTRVIDQNRIPIGTSIMHGKPDLEDINEWWRGRSIPASRQNFQWISQRMGNLCLSKKLQMSAFGLSLSDQYWINPADSPLDWDKINFWGNDFSEDVGNILFDNIPKGKLNLVSPDNTSDGWLKKKWKVINDKRCLIKGGDGFQQQPLNEVMATAVLRRLDIPHVPYTLIWEDELPYSGC